MGGYELKTKIHAFGFRYRYVTPVSPRVHYNVTVTVTVAVTVIQNHDLGEYRTTNLISFSALSLWWQKAY